MVKSMTGFGRASLTEGSLSVTVEIKAVNHRYFEFSSRLPRGCAYLEEKLKSFCQEKIARGKTEVSVQLENIGTDGTVVEINEAYANAYLEALRRFAKQYGVKNDVRLSALVGNGELFTVKKQQVSEEKITVLDDTGILCLGEREFEYNLYLYHCDKSELCNEAAKLYAEPQISLFGKSYGNLPKEMSLVSIDNNKIHISAIKPSENGAGIIVRLFNPTNEVQAVTLDFGIKYKNLYICGMDETVKSKADCKLYIEHKKIITVYLEF